MAEMSYPLTCVVEGSKTAYLYRCLQLLMNMQNVFSKWYHEGLTELEWADGIPYQLRLLPQYGYSRQIDEKLMKRFLNEEYYPRSYMLEEEILKRRFSHKTSDRWTIDVFEIPKFESS
jgi:hypothetical protein